MSERIKEQVREFLLLYRVEVLLMGVSVVLVIASGALLFTSPKEIKAQQKVVKSLVAVEEKEEETFIFVDISGAIEYPDVYKLPEGTRLNELVEKAGGISDAVDREQVEQTMNLARVLADQEKIYIPKIGDRSVMPTEVGLPAGQAGISNTAESKIDINKASSSELDSLPGIGPVTAQKIIDGRPYTTVVDLVSRKIIGQALYERIQDSFIVE